MLVEAADQQVVVDLQRYLDYLVQVGGGGSTVSSFVSPLFPLSIKVLWGNGDVPVTRVGLLLRVLADTGVLSVDIQI